jgi:hypothetical protein
MALEPAAATPDLPRLSVFSGEQPAWVVSNAPPLDTHPVRLPRAVALIFLQPNVGSG